MKKLFVVLALALLAGCKSVAPGPGNIERMYVIDCGENHVKDLSRWTPGVNVGQPYVFSDLCYLIRHAHGWFLWDSGNPDRLAALPNGLTAPNGIITAHMRTPIVDSLWEIGLTPRDIRYFAMSHSHGDHSGNANLFTRAKLYMQRVEYDAVFGAEPQKYNFIAANFEKLRDSKVVKLDGDFDVFGDGSVVIKSTPGHTPGHQSLFVRFLKRKPVLLTGDMVHLKYSWDNRVVPGFNFDVAQSGRSIDAMKAFVAQTGAEVWISHDKTQNNLIPKSPIFIE